MNRLIPVILLFLISLLFIHPFDGTSDFYHHVNSGKYMIETGEFPNLDSYSHTANGQPWIAHSWLSGLIFFAIFNSLGYLGIVTLLWTTGFLTLGLLYLYLKIQKLKTLPIIITLSFATIILNLRWPARPEVFSFPLVISLLLVDEFHKKYTKVAILIPLIIVIWTNLYGASALMGLGLVTLLVGKQLVVDKFKIESNQKNFYLLSAISYPLSLLNPYGFSSLFYSFFFIPKVAVYEAEWAGIQSLITNLPAGFLLNMQYQILIYFVFLALISLLALFSFKHLTSHFFPSILAFSILTPILTFRHFQVAIVLTAPLLAITLSLALQKKRKLTLVISTLILIINLGFYFWINPPKKLKNENPGATAMVNFVKENNLSGNAFNHINLGGFLSYNLHPQVKIFYDTRDELYLDTQANKDLMGLTGQNANILPFLEKYNIDLVFINLSTDNLPYKDLFYSGNWSIVFYADQYLIAMPTKTAEEKGLKILSAIDPYAANAAKPGKEDQALNEYQDSLAINLTSYNTNLYLGRLKMFLGQNEEAVKNFEAINVGTGPGKFIAEKDRDFQIAQAHLNAAKVNPNPQTCSKIKDLLSSVSDESPVLFFTQEPYLLTELNKYQAFYYLLCEQDQTLAQRHLSSYLGQPGITPLEKARTEQEFYGLLK